MRASFLFCFKQELVSGGTTSTVLRNLNANTMYKVTLLPMYENDVEGKRQSENGKTSESSILQLPDYRWRIHVLDFWGITYNIEAQVKCGHVCFFLLTQNLWEVWRTFRWPTRLSTLWECDGMPQTGMFANTTSFMFLLPEELQAR